MNKFLSTFYSAVMAVVVLGVVSCSSEEPENTSSVNESLSENSTNTTNTNLNTPPDVPLVVTASSNQKECIHLSWRAVSGATFYRVYRSRDGVTYKYLFEVTETNIDDRSFTNESVKLGFWHYKVTAVNSYGESDKSGDVVGKALGWRFYKVIGNVSQSVDLTLDPDGYPHIVYWDYDVNKFRHAYSNSSGWFVEDVSNGSSAFARASIAIDSSGNVYVSYDGSDNYLYCACKSNGGSSWSSELVTNLYCASVSSVAVGSSGYPHISFYAIATGGFYAYKDSSGWHIEKFDPSPGSAGAGRQSSVVLDSSGYPHISYFKDDVDSVKYSYKDDSGWHTNEIDSPCSNFQTSIVLDSNGNFHVSYSGGIDHILKHAWGSDGNWQVESVDNGTSTGDHASIVAGVDNCIYISYLNSNSLKIAWKESGGNWTNEMVSEDGDYSYNTSIDVSGDGMIHIAYISSNANLVYAYGYVR